MEKRPILSAAARRVEMLSAQINDEQMPDDLAGELMRIDNMDVSAFYEQSKKIVNTVIDLKELMMMYSCAIKEMRTKLEILDIEYNVRNQRNPIKAINTRLKRLTSIMEKLERGGIPFSLENIENKINDVAGIRVICSYVDDIYVISEALKSQGDIELIAEKDYIANPKPNGYRSLHLIVTVPVFFTDQMKKMKVEIQIRTIAMDFWATLEHQLKYRQQLTNGEEIASRLKECAEIISDTDSRMLDIRKQIEADNGEPTEEDILLEKIKKIDSPIE